MLVKDVIYKNVKRGLYTIDEYGNIFSKYKNDYLIPSLDKDGYKRIALSGGGRDSKIYVRIANLVAYTFIGHPPNDMVDPTVNHIDGDNCNNHYSNLEWMERGENSSIRNIKPKGELNGQHILTEKNVIEICELILEGKLPLVEIGRRFNVHKSTISNIKRKKAWIHITKDYNFKTKKQKNKVESKIQREEIINFIKKGCSTWDIIKMGYPKTVVYRTRDKYVQESR